MLPICLLVVSALCQDPEPAPYIPPDNLLVLPHEFRYEELVQEMTDLRRLTVPPVPGERAFQFSSWDRRSRGAAPDSEDWFANSDHGQFLRSEEGASGGTEFVLAEAEGPGVITRIWSANPAGDLLFYVDGAAEPAMRVAFQDLCRGDVEPFLEPLAGVRGRGWNCYVPLPFQESIKVTATEQDFYYHVNVRTYPPGTTVPSLSMDLLVENQPFLEEAGNILTTARMEPLPVRSALKAGALVPGKEVITSLRGAGTLRGFDLQIFNFADIEDLESMLRAVRIQVDADLTGTPQVDCPLGDFFATGPGFHPHGGFPVGVTGNSLRSRLPMPFGNGMTVRLINEGKQRVVFRLVMALDELECGPLRLHAGWRQVRDLPTLPRSDFRVVRAEGPGRFLGSMLTVRNLTRAWWGEGDEKFFVDGEAFPSTFGTGTEDYYGYAWASNELFSSPQHGQTRCDGPGNYGYSSVHRFQLADHVPFQESFLFDLEVWHWQELDVDYVTTAWWYAPAAAGDDIPPLPPVAERLARPVPELQILRVEGAAEAELLQSAPVVGQGRVQRQPMAGYGNHWSAEEQLWWTEGKPGDKLVVELPVEEGGRYRLQAMFTRARDYAIVHVLVNGERVLENLDLYSEKVEPSELVDLGVLRFNRGTARVVIEIAGANEKAVPGYMVGLDYLLLTPDQPEGGAQDGAPAPDPDAMDSLYSLQTKALDGGGVALSGYREQVTLVVNVASECGYTPQYAGLQELHEELSRRGFAVLGFPSNEFGGQEPGDAAQIREFCDSRFGVTFPMFEKVEVKPGGGQSPVYGFLTRGGDVPNWNFCRYLVGKDGRVLGFYPSKVAPDDQGLRSAIEAALAE